MKKFFQTKDKKKKKVLLVGLGLLGGGRAMAEFILKEGGELYVTDLRTEEILKEEVKAVKSLAKKYKQKKLFTVFGEHTFEMFESADVVVFNPAVPYISKWPKWCKENDKEYYNDFTLFQEFFYKKYILNKKKNTNIPKQIWITGTRGKTTTTNFIKDLLGKDALIGGNQPGSSLQKICYKTPKYFVLETSNHQLEYPILNKEIKEPAASVITNIYIDHVSRHGSFEAYKAVKHNIYSYNETSPLFLLENEKSVSDIWENKFHENVVKVDEDKYGYSQNQDKALSLAISVAKYFGVSAKEISKRSKKLSFPKMRQEIVGKSKNYIFVNDSAATSPDATLSSFASFKNGIFIVGGTDANLDFAELVEEIKNLDLLDTKRIKFLDGTATHEILRKLNLQAQKELVFDNFQDCLEQIFIDHKDNENKNESQYVILSPGAKSFGLFKNEFDRGARFNTEVKKICKKRLTRKK